MSSDLLFDPLSIDFARILLLLFHFCQRYLHNTLNTQSAGFHIYTSNPHPVHVELICFFLLEIPQILPLTALVGFLHTDQYGLDMLSLPVYSPVSIDTILAELLRFPFCFPCKILFFDISVQIRYRICISCLNTQGAGSALNYSCRSLSVLPLVLLQFPDRSCYYTIRSFLLYRSSSF